MLNPTWLKTFITLIETGHFTKTAERLFMTQPGVSQHIKKLEEACGHPLIARQNKSFEITEAGKTVYDYAKQLDVQQAQMLSSLGNDDPLSGTVSLACSGSLALLLYPHLLHLQSQHPQLVTQVEAAPHRKVMADIISGEADIGIVTHAPTDPRIKSEQFGVEPLCLMLPKNAPSQNITQAELQEIGLIRHPDAEHFLSLFFSQCGESQLKNLDINAIPIRGYVNQLSQILLPIAKGLGCTVLPNSALDAFPLKSQVLVYQPQRAVVEPLYVITKRHRQTPARFDTVKAVIGQQLN